MTKDITLFADIFSVSVLGIVVRDEVLVDVFVPYEVPVPEMKTESIVIRMR